ncbi:hypothetical protein ASPCAL00581 [Aspergillus calidoustus]|uniref:Nuclear speckle splicing regulatory protein 1 N-terminal domain-containing protein n=1 Tax=Aspergillus calidoustus TaxID=454130 RepID=A0A0U5FQV3_ASPCI|nr:hypothetical protein ASPCAL00581 [Aspergillus calidoustus]
MRLNLSKNSKPNPLKPNPLAGGGGQKRKKGVFGGDSDDEDGQERRGTEAQETAISTLGGIDDDAPSVSAGNSDDARPAKRKIVPLGQGAKPKIKPLSKASIFADDEDDEKTDGQDINKDKAGHGGTKYGLNSAPPDREYTNLSALHSSKKHAAEAQDVDPSIYSYDAVYESLHVKPKKKSTAEDDESGDGVPRYMTSLLRSAEIRKRDQMRARDRLLAKEREAEGEEFADKEKFVTSAYKEQHEAVMKAADEAARKVKEGATGDGAPATSEEEEKEKEKTEAQMAAELNARGAHIAVNDDGQVVDKRQLLSAGLNVAPKPKTAAPTVGKPSAGPSAASRARPVQTGGRAAQRARQTEMIAAQLEEQERQRQEAEAAKQREIAERNRSQKTNTEVSSARERYLARKREREAAKGS